MSSKRKSTHKQHPNNIQVNASRQKSVQPRAGTYLVELRAGDGGDDAVRFAKELSESFSKWLRAHGHDVTQSDDKRRGIITLTADGDPAEMRQYSGVHRIQRVSGGTKRHSSTVTVAIVLPKTTTARLVDRELRMEFFRGSGPGGQHRNTSEQAVRLIHVPTGTTVEIDGRSRANNIKLARGELLRRLQGQADVTSRSRTHAQRRAQIGVPQRSGKTFTHNQQRGVVVDHSGGRRWRMRDFRKGRLDSYATATKSSRR